MVGINRSTALALALTGALGGLTSACKEGSPLEGGISPATAGFSAELPPDDVTSRFVSLRMNSISEGRIIVDVIVTEVEEPVTSLNMKLTYPSEFSKFIACTDGDLFPQDQCYFAEPFSGSGEVFVSRFMTGTSEAPTVDGERVVMRLEFLVFGVSQGPITIEGQNLGGGDTSALLDVNGDPIFVRWYAGTLLGT